jgi:hypothetical protein
MLSFTDVTLGSPATVARAAMSAAREGIYATTTAGKAAHAPLPSQASQASQEADQSAFTASGSIGRKAMLVFAALLAGGGTYYTLTQTAWGAKTRLKLGL